MLDFKPFQTVKISTVISYKYLKSLFFYSYFPIPPQQTHEARLRRGYLVTIMLSGGIIIIGCILLVAFSDKLIVLFRDDPDVVRIGTRALRLQAVAQLVMPVCMSTEMLFQCVGKRFSASIQSSLRSGAIFIPLLIILARTRGIAGIQEAQPLAFALSFPISVIFALRFFRAVPKEDMSAPDV